MEVQNISTDTVNFVPDPGGPECGTSEPNCKGTLLSTPGSTSGSSVVVDVIPYGTAVQVTDEQGNGVTFEGSACTGGGATVTATECDFTMAPWDNLFPNEPDLLIRGG